MAKQTVILTFNKSSGVFTGFIYHGSNKIAQSDLNTEFFLYKTVEMDPDLETWVGDVSTGKIVTIESQPLEVKESDIDRDTQKFIFNKYKYYKQINIIFDVIDQLADIQNPETPTTFADFDTTNYDTFKQFMADTIAKNLTEKESVQANPDYVYVSKKQENQLFQDTYAGDGLRGAIQPEHPFDIIQ